MARPKKVDPMDLQIQEMLKAAFAKAGVNPDDVPIEEDIRDTPQRTLFRGQAVVRSLDFPLEKPLVAECKRKGCGQVFTKNYAAVAYCSTECLATAITEDYGMVWKPNHLLRKERWEIRAEPEMIPMQALQAMKAIVVHVESCLGRPIEMDSSPSVPQCSEKHQQPVGVSEISLVPIQEELAPISDKQQSQVHEEPESQIQSTKQDDPLGFLYAL